MLLVAFASAVLGVPTHNHALQLLTGAPYSALDPAEADIVARHPEDSVAPLPPEALASSPLLQPRMMLSNGCAMSTFTLKTSIDILKLHQPAGAAEYELTKCANNRFCNDTAVQGLYNSSTHVLSAGAIPMQLAAGYFAAVHNATLVFKGDKPTLGVDAKHPKPKTMHDADGMLDAVRELGTHTVYVLRTNALDSIVCEVHDCMGNPAMGYQINHSTHERAHPQHNTDGTTKTACNNWRRALPSEEQTLVHLNVSRLRQAIDSGFERSSSASLARLAGLESGQLKVFDSRTLLAWQEDKNEATLQRSLAAWLALLEAWDVAPNATAVRSYLVENGWGERPAVPKEEAIANYAEVAEAPSNRNRNPHPNPNPYLNPHPLTRWRRPSPHGAPAMRRCSMRGPTTTATRPPS